VFLQSSHAQMNEESDMLKSSVGVSDSIVYTQLQALKKKKVQLKNRIALIQKLLQVEAGCPGGVSSLPL
jgi:hypothetical protein